MVLTRPARRSSPDSIEGRSLFLASLPFPALCLQEKSLDRELNRMGVSSHEPLVLARSSHGTTPLMAAAGCPSRACVRLVSLRIVSYPEDGNGAGDLRCLTGVSVLGLDWTGLDWIDNTALVVF